MTHYLQELGIHFNVIPGNVFEHVRTPLACGGVGLFVDEILSYSVLEKASTESFQALWIEIYFVKKKKTLCVESCTVNTIIQRAFLNTWKRLSTNYFDRKELG